MSIVNQLREAIKRDGRSVNAIALAAGLSAIQVSRFLRGIRGLTTPAVDALCETLGLELRAKRPKQKAR